MPKYFTVDEADRSLALVRRIVTDISAAHQERMKRIVEYEQLEAHPEGKEERSRKLGKELRELTDVIVGYVEELEEIGVQFKGFEPGLVDFPALLDGRPILLCWKLGEEKVEYWHEVEAGYAGRQRLPEHLVRASDDG
jgi:hypothetical protein